MKMTDEMVDAIASAVGSTAWDGFARQSRIFLAGYRMGQRDMRERAAQRCERARGTGMYPEAQAYNDACDNLAEAIRDLEDTNG